MRFREMLKPLREGKGVRRAIWSEWWGEDEHKEIVTHYRDGRIVNIRDMDMLWLFENLCADDWEVVVEDEVCCDGDMIFANTVFDSITDTFLENGGVLNADMARMMKKIAQKMCEDYNIYYRL